MYHSCTTDRTVLDGKTRSGGKPWHLVSDARPSYLTEVISMLTQNNFRQKFVRGPTVVGKGGTLDGFADDARRPPTPASGLTHRRARHLRDGAWVVDRVAG